jgi:hypothetical protein
MRRLLLSLPFTALSFAAGAEPVTGVTALPVTQALTSVLVQGTAIGSRRSSPTGCRPRG